MAGGAAEALHRVLGRRLDEDFEVWVSAERLWALLISRFVDDGVASHAPVDSGDFHEIYVVPQLGKYHLLDLQGGGHEIEHRSVQEPGDESRFDLVELLLEPSAGRGCLAQFCLHFPNLTR